MDIARKRARQNAWLKAHPETARRNSIAYYWRHREKVLARAKERRKFHDELHEADPSYVQPHKLWRLRNPERAMEQNRKAFRKWAANGVGAAYQRNRRARIRQEALNG